MQKPDSEIEDKCPCLKTCCDNPRIQGDQDSSECLNCYASCLCNN